MKNRHDCEKAWKSVIVERHGRTKQVQERDKSICRTCSDYGNCDAKGIDGLSK